MNVIESIQGALTSTFTTAGNFVPKLIGALIIFLIGWIIAKVLRTVINKVLKAIKFDDIADSLGINSMLAKGGLKTRASGMFATLVYWIVMFVTYISVFDTLGLEVVSNLLRDAVGYIPKVIIALILLVVGAMIAKFASEFVGNALKANNFPKADLVSKLAYGGVMFLIIPMALGQLGIGAGILDKVVGIVLGALGLGLSIAFGLGGKDWAADQIKKLS